MIESITLDAKNAFGIGLMNKEFKFKGDKSGRCMAIYAPNGTCKSSIRKSLERWNLNSSVEDVFFPDKESSFNVATSPDADAIPRGNIFCFKSMPEFESMRYFDDQLIASPELKAQYVDFTTRHRREVDVLLASIRDEFISGRGTPGPNDMRDYIKSLTGKGDLYEALESLLARADGLSAPEFMKEKKQNDLLKKGFEDKISKGSAKASIQGYVAERNNVMESSTIYHNGFDPNAANELAAALAKAHFFEAGHSLILHDQTTDSDLTPIRNEKDLKEVLDSEFSKVTSDPNVRKAYASVDKAIGQSKDADEIRGLLCDTPGFAEAVTDLPSLKLDYLAYAADRCRPAVEALLKGKDEYLTKMAELTKKAREESTDWDKAIKLFERRFHVPFSLRLDNRASAIVEGDEPIIEFSFSGKTTSYKKLCDNLSDGERKALYMLSVIFLVEQAKRAEGPRLLVFDDVVDSFDYVNKYAFIEYLREFSDAPDLYIILLTHNYDFFRTVTSRLDGFSRANCVIVDKGAESRLEFEQVEFLDANPFSLWKKSMGEDAFKVAAVPMVRELVAIRCGKDSDDYDMLSRALHGRGGGDVTFGDLHECFAAHWDFHALEGDGERVGDVTKRVCKDLYERGGNLRLQEKVAMALGIRFLVEGCLGRLYAAKQRKMPDSEKMGKLIRDYRENFQDDYERHGSIAEEAAIITPENIHVNSFMYEPLVDIGSQRFFDLYGKCIEWEDEGES